MCRSRPTPTSPRSRATGRSATTTTSTTRAERSPTALLHGRGSAKPATTTSATSTSRCAPRKAAVAGHASEPTEAECQATIIEAARVLGYRVAHFRAARTMHGWRTPLQGDAGWPDLVIAGHGHCLVVELKR